MEVHNKNHESFLHKLNKRLKKKKFRLIFSLLISGFLFGIGLGLGAYLNSTGRTSVLRMGFFRMSNFDFSFIPNYVDAQVQEVDEFDIDIKFVDFEKLRYLREKALVNGGITEEIQKEVPAKIKYNNHTYKVSLCLTGMTNAHILSPNKWSLAVKVKNGKTIMGLRKFAILYTKARGYLTDWIATELLKSRNVIGIRGNFVNVKINGNDNGLYYLEERFDKRLIENNKRREGIIFKINGSDLNFYNKKKISTDTELSSQRIKIKQMWNSFLNDEIEANKLFDLKKMASLYVVSDLMHQKHALFPSNMRLYFNPITSLIEPIGREWGFLRKETTIGQISLFIEKPNPKNLYHVSLSENDVLKKIFSTSAFKEEYIKEANILSNKLYLDSIIAKNQDKIDLLLGKIYKQNPFYIFPTDLLHKYQDYIRRKLHPKLPSIVAYFNNITNNTISLSVENNIDLPIEIKYLRYNNDKIIYPKERLLLKSKYKVNTEYQEVSLAIDNNINIANFSPDSLEIYYNILGMDSEIKNTILFPKKKSEMDFANLNPTTITPNINDFSCLDIDDDNKIISFKSGMCNIKNDLMIPDGYSVLAKPNSIINLTNRAKIISYSPLFFFGTKQNPIKITSIDTTGQGIVIFNAQRSSELSHVIFENLSNISQKGWELRGAVTFYESPVTINNCIFKNNLKGDDFLNIVRTDFHIQNTTFENIFADALDTDFCKGTVSNVNFLKIGNDALDISGSEVFAKKIFILNTGDKGLSAGEGSNLICNNIEIDGGEIAVASKDNSTVSIDGISIKSCQLAYCAFQKKSEFGPAIIKIIKSNLSNVGREFLIEKGSLLTIDGNNVKNKIDNVKTMLYGSKYGKASR